MTIPSIALNDGNHIPLLGLGTYKTPADTTAEVVGEAIRLGYRHIDTAALYGNEAGVGRAVRDSGLPRSEFFVTTKVWNTEQGAAKTAAAFEKSMDELGLDTVDLYLIHWPCPGNDLYVDTWRELERIRESGRARSIGVSNFAPEHLERLAQETSIKPVLNQIELHPALQQREIVDYCREHGIEIESWGPLGQGKYPLLEMPEITAAAAAHGKTPAQVVLRWHVQQRFIVFPKSTSPARLAENMDVFDFALSDAEMAAITALESGRRGGPDPREFNA
ncbi:MAG TPA: aldo/keto reductase [Microbacteriaceae bacterium]|nr:aldo/keto reductase [Microbacteriaceae bacterium]